MKSVLVGIFRCRHCHRYDRGGDWLSGEQDVEQAQRPKDIERQSSGWGRVGGLRLEVRMRTRERDVMTESLT